ncbi:hypothetical protein THAOC_13387, partial [Thalassiosira oceanica]
RQRVRTNSDRSWQSSFILNRKLGFTKAMTSVFLLVQPAQNPGSLKSEETRLENIRAGQLDALASLVLFQKYLATSFQLIFTVQIRLMIGWEGSNDKRSPPFVPEVSPFALTNRVSPGLEPSSKNPLGNPVKGTTRPAVSGGRPLEP